MSEQVGIERLVEGRWTFWKYVEEPEFGPGRPIHTVFITGNYALANKTHDGSSNPDSFRTLINSAMLDN